MRFSGERFVSFSIGLAAAILLFILLETIFRLFFDVPVEPYPGDYAIIGDPLFQYDPILFWRPRPNRNLAHLSTNSLGLRDDEFPKKVTGKRFWVLCLGDSPTWGDKVGFRGNYPNLLEALLKERRPDISVEVLNAGIPAYSTFQSMRLERELLDRFDFEVVIINNMGSDMMPVKRGDGEYMKSTLQARLLKTLLKSKFYCYIRNGLLYRERAGALYSPDMRPRVSLEEYAGNLHAMVEMAQGDNARVILLSPLPLCREEGCPADPSYSPLNRHMEKIQELEDRYRMAMKRAAEEIGIVMVDAFDVVRNRAHKHTLYADVVHPSQKGHELIADLLLPEVEHILKTPVPVNEPSVGGE